MNENYGALPPAGDPWWDQNPYKLPSGQLGPDLETVRRRNAKRETTR